MRARAARVMATAGYTGPCPACFSLDSPRTATQSIVAFGVRRAARSASLEGLPVVVSYLHDTRTCFTWKGNALP